MWVVYAMFSGVVLALFLSMIAHPPPAARR